MPGIDGNLPQAYHDGSWKDWSEVKGKFNGEWENASDVYVKDAGVWKQVWVRLTAPTNGSSSVSGLTATISWTPGVGQEGFKLYRNGDFIKNVAANATSTTDTLPAYNTDYTYTVSAFAGATETAQVFSGVVSAPLTEPTGGSTSLSDVTATISWTPGVGQEGFKLYRNGTFVKNVAANVTSTTDTLPALNATYTYTVSAFAGTTETAQISCGDGVSQGVGVPTTSVVVTTDWAYTNDSWNNQPITFNTTCTVVANATSYQWSLNDGTSAGGTANRAYSFNLNKNDVVNVRWRAVRIYAEETYNGAWSTNTKTVNAGQPLVRTASSQDITVDALSDVPGTFSRNYGALGTIVDSYQWRNGRARRTDGTLWSSEFTNSSSRSVRLRRPSGAGGNIDLSFISRSNGWDSDVLTGYVDGTWGISLLGTGWFSSTGSNPDNKCRITLRFNVRAITQDAVAYSIS